MANEVFANNMEVACKAADGRSTACFPDVCFTPPRTSASPPGIPIPYPNTAFAKDTKNGSKTVRISGKEVVLRDKSYIKKSTGNEAGSADKGIITKVNKGKAYFKSWSMDVKIEGLNVCRHLDLMTHNHGSDPSNTGVWSYTDTSSERKDCKRDRKRVERKCKPTKKQGGKRVFDSKPGEWKKEQCMGLQVPPPTSNSFDPDELREQFDELFQVEDIIKEALQEARDFVQDQIESYLVKKAASTAGKSFFKAWLGPIGWAWTAYDIYDGISTVGDMRELLSEITTDLENLRSLPGELERLKQQGMTPKTLADAQALIARVNPCLRARKCMLVPYKKRHQTSGGSDNSGCCRGQTAHHLIPTAFFKDSECEAYNRNNQADKAPTVCVEGTSHSRGGSHQVIHGHLDQLTRDNADSNGEMSYKDARDMAIESHEKTFGGKCQKKCLKAQLDNFYKKLCGGDNFKVKANSAINGNNYTNDNDSL